MNTLSETLTREAHAILSAIHKVASDYDHALTFIARGDPVLWSGMGKSGYVAQKAASTLRSLGVPSHYVHPAEASHGDLGAITARAVAVVLSNSGETPELADLLFFAQDNCVPVIALTGRADSTLAKAAKVALVYGPVSEVCPNGLAPTTSTTVAMALCDAIAVDLAHERGITAADFRRYHPGGKLGARLQVAKDVMRGPVSHVSLESSLVEAALSMTGEVAGICLVVGPHGMEGVLTDGDLRRLGERAFTGELRAGEAMTQRPVVVKEHDRLDHIKQMMDARRVTKVLVEDALGSIVGVVNIHDIQG